MGELLNFPGSSRKLVEDSPHKVRLNHCRRCDMYIKAQWDLALRSRYEDDGYEEHEPRADHPFDIDLDEDRYS